MLKNLAFILPILLGIALVQSRVFPRQSIGPPSTDAACLSPPPDTCTFYADCLESRYHCGPTGYPIGYGQRFCGEFVGNKSLLDTDGQTWMVNTMHCLQLALVPDAVDANATTCPALETQAFGTHAGCYVNNGLCSLGIHDWLAIIEIVDIKTLFDSWDAFKATVEAAGDCAAFIAWMVAKGLF
ncbi:hypothetical protein FIBSPDRAFT_856524 [Athelia psychrophila]|uniref:Chitin-binding type-2 domain-containing protein n=1 Tax=Athelia psychrophila TaxID=1759441 RepID=A0A166N8J2_9AGAM|nr:hypothetical protein FIBSPDRAFT_856524 [Fibularhizoctonia sp. CBS 109695]